MRSTIFLPSDVPGEPVQAVGQLVHCSRTICKGLFGSMNNSTVHKLNVMPCAERFMVREGR